MSKQKTIRVSFQVTFEEYYMFVKQHLPNKGLYVIMFIGSLLLSVFLLFGFVDGFDITDIFGFGAIFFALFVFTYLKIFIKQTARKNYNSSSVLNSKADYEINNNALKVKTKFDKAQTLWSAYSHVVVKGELLFLYRANNVGIIFPKRAFDSEQQWDEFVALVSSNVPRK